MAVVQDQHHSVLLGEVSQGSEALNDMSDIFLEVLLLRLKPYNQINLNFAHFILIICCLSVR